MADSLCGPSNALQSFQKHSTVDRTLQQDRLTSRHLPSQGFRSTGSSSTLLDPEFEAFQAGQVPFPHPEGVGFSQEPYFPAPQQFQQTAAPSWVGDFQRLNVSTPPPQFQPQNFPQQARQSHQGSWNQQFVQHEKQLSGSSSHGHLGYNAPLERLSSLAQLHQQDSMSELRGDYHAIQPYYRGSLGAVPNTMLSPQTQEQQPVQVEAFDEAAFARAFDEAAKSEFLVEQSSLQEQSEHLGQDILINESAERFVGPRERIGADLIHDPDQESSTDPQHQNDPDALARTAGQLLNSVKDNHSSKFQNSTFLELMRQLRDKEVTVEGDKIVDIGASDAVQQESHEQHMAAP